MAERVVHFLMGLPVDRGIMVRNVVSEGPAAKAELRGSDRTVESERRTLPAGGDIIISLDGQMIHDTDDLINNLSERLVGRKVTLRIIRTGEERAVEVILEERPARLLEEKGIISPSRLSVGQHPILGTQE